ncbi:MAG: type II secretion system major pseudopilin GspG [Phycisphaerae bacterium]|nr:type II secretion system major pseudopilin GspG [Tepidisphaeraceae bacterium]
MRTRMRQSTDRAFTLIELLLVLVIIAALAAIVIPNLAGKGQKAKVETTKASLSAIQNALKMYEVENSKFPSTEEGVGLLTEQPADSPLLEKKHLIDAWNNAWNYRYPGTVNPRGFDIFSSGPDGRPGTEDDIYP